jgi:hypothetical protein
MIKLPDKLFIKKWYRNKKDLPKESSCIYAVLCRKKDTKEEWFSVAEFVRMRLPNCKVDFDEWRILGPLASSSYARGSTDNWFDVVAWGKISQ